MHRRSPPLVLLMLPLSKPPFPPLVLLMLPQTLPPLLHLPLSLILHPRLLLLLLSSLTLILRGRLAAVGVANAPSSPLFLILLSSNPHCTTTHLIFSLTAPWAPATIPLRGWRPCAAGALLASTPFLLCWRFLLPPTLPLNLLNLLFRALHRFGRLLSPLPIYPPFPLSLVLRCRCSGLRLRLLSCSLQAFRHGYMYGILVRRV